MFLKLRNSFLIVLMLSFLINGCALIKTPNLTDNGAGILALSSSPLMWQKERGPQFSSWEEADNYVKNLELGGYSDWRLPTEEEFLQLYFLFDYGKAKADELGIEIEGNYWSADKDGLGFSGAWKDGEICEITRNFKPSTKGYVRAIRP